MTQVTNFFVQKNRNKRNLFRFGSSSWARTSDIMINSHALCQLSYRGIFTLLVYHTNHKLVKYKFHNTEDISIFGVTFRQLSTFPGSLPPSIIDVKGLNFCVRHGNRWIPLAIVTGYSLFFKGYTLKTKQYNSDTLNSFPSSLT